MKKSKKPNFVKASGAPFSDEDIQLIGTELVKIAEAHRVEDVRLLDKKIVFAVVEADPNHPLRKLYDWDVKRAARKHWIDWTHKIILSVRIEWTVGKFTRPLPISLSVEVPQLKQGSARRRVLTADVLANDPMFASAVGLQIRNIDSALVRIETLAAAHGRPSPELESLVSNLRAVFNEYYASLVQKAAE